MILKGVSLGGIVKLLARGVRRSPDALVVVAVVVGVVQVVWLAVALFFGLGGYGAIWNRVFACLIVGGAGVLLEVLFKLTEKSNA